MSPGKAKVRKGKKGKETGKRGQQNDKRMLQKAEGWIGTHIYGPPQKKTFGIEWQRVI